MPNGYLNAGAGYGGGILGGQSRGALSGLLDPQVALPIAAAMIGAPTFQQSLAGGFAAAAPGLKDMQRRKAVDAWLKWRIGKGDLAPEEVEYIRGDPELAAKLFVSDRNLGGAEYGLAPVWMRDPKTDKLVLGQMNSAGGMKPVDTGGLEPLDPIRTIDTGTGTLVLGGRSGEVRPNVGQGGVVPKDIAGAETAKTLANAEAEAKVSLPAKIAKADTALRTIHDIKNDPTLTGGYRLWGMNTGIGGTGMLAPLTNAVGGSNTYDFQKKVEQLQGSAFLSAFESLRGGGQISNVEGEKATVAIFRAQTAQSEEAFKKALADLEDVINIGKQVAIQMANTGMSAAEARAALGLPVDGASPAAAGGGQTGAKPDPFGIR